MQDLTREQWVSCQCNSSFSVFALPALSALVANCKSHCKLQTKRPLSMVNAGCWASPLAVDSVFVSSCFGSERAAILLPTMT
jgi:hypothetical protein